MTTFESIIFLTATLALLLVCLIIERRLLIRHRASLRHIVHVNGTRGKSAVTRLIAAGLSEGGIRTFCKTTGTLPMTIDCEGNEKLINRRGFANIKEQIWVVGQAAADKAEVLVTECMAVDPELQYICQDKILKADIGVITNARVDHVAEMGDNATDVARALSGTIPKGGFLFTSDAAAFEIFAEVAKGRDCQPALCGDGEELDIDAEFKENYELALCVCEQLGVSRDIVLAGMLKVIKDPYTGMLYELPGGKYFIDAMSANDPYSTKLVIERLSPKATINKKIIILNTRADRGYRTELMLKVIEELRPDEVYLMGGGALIAMRRLKSLGIKAERFKAASELPLSEQETGTLICGIGNIASQGIKLMEIVRKEGKICTLK